jgi:3-methyladenine DNA glycosylase/8-oxoguanine DNA glycosylase
MTSESAVRTWRPKHPVDIVSTLAVHQRSSADPTYRRESGEAVWRTARTPEGPVTARFCVRRSEQVVFTQAWGPGASWLLDHVPGWLGADDDASEFQPHEQVLRDAYVRHAGFRIGRTSLVLESLVPAVLEQKVTGSEAWRGWRTLLRWYGEPAPGPVPPGLRLVPDAATWRHIPSWDWHRAGVGPDRSKTVIRAARVADRLEEIVDLPPAQRAGRLRMVLGVGGWTAAEVLQRVCGDADAVSVGDFHLPRLVVWALSSRVSDADDDMLELLEPYRPHRYRVTRLLEMSGVRPPRFGPRLAPRDYRAI